MNILLLGRGKTGSLVEEVALHRGHTVHAVGAAENVGGAALTNENLAKVDVVVDFTAPPCVLPHIEASVKARKNIVVGTTGWYGEINRIKQLVESQQAGLLYAANFSIGVNLFLEVARAAA